jgi:hypothetical protein
VKSIEFLPEAREEVLGAVARYEEEIAGLGEEFLNELHITLDRVVEFPYHGSPYFLSTRTAILRRFPSTSCMRSGTTLFWSLRRRTNTGLPATGAVAGDDSVFA